MTTERHFTIELDLRVSGVARLLHMSESRVRELLASGAVPTAYRTEGGQWRVQPDGIRRWLEERSL